jgi:hypothetical protein
VISAHPEAEQRITNVTPLTPKRFAARFESEITGLSSAMRSALVAIADDELRSGDATWSGLEM